MSNGQQLPQRERVQQIASAIQVYQESFGVQVADQAQTARFKSFCGKIAELVETNQAFSDADTASRLQIARRVWDTDLWPGMTDGEAYIVSYGKKAQYMVGPRGWITMLYRAGAKSVLAECVHEGDTFDPGSLIPRTPPKLVPSRDQGRSATKFTHAIAYVEWADGTWDAAIADGAYLERVKKASPAGSNGPWGKWPERMAQAKALRLLARDVSRRTNVPESMRKAMVAAVEHDAADAEDAEVVGLTVNDEPPKPTEPPPVTTKARGSRARKAVEKAPADAQDAPGAPDSTPAPSEQPVTLEALVDAALKSRESENVAKAEWESAYDGVSLHAVSIRRAIGGPFRDEAEAADALRRFIG